MCAIAAGKELNAELLLKAGADVNLENENRETVLHMTRSRDSFLFWNPDRTDLLRMVIDSIADINKRVGRDTDYVIS